MKTLKPQGTADAAVASWKKLVSSKGWTPVGRGIFGVGKTAVELRPGFGNSWRLGFIGTAPYNRGKGHGSKALKKITTAADKAGVQVTATVQPQKGGGLNKRQLHSWYKRNGFVRQPYAWEPNKKSDEIVRGPLKRLQAIARLVEFGWIADNPGALTATKNLLRGLKKRGVRMNRVPADFAKKFGDTTTYRPFLRSITSVRGGVIAPPVSEMWHEAGHDLTRRHSMSSLASSLGRPWADPIEDARGERMANRAAVRAMGRLGAPTNQREKYVKAVTPAYNTYRKNPFLGGRRFLKSIPASPVAY